MQLCKNYVNLKHCIVYSPEIQCKCHKLERAIFRRHLFQKKNLQIKVKKKKSVLKFPEFFICRILNCIFTNILVNVGMRTDEAFYNISMFLYNKNVLEYAQIARNETESKIPYIEGCSNV